MGKTNAEHQRQFRARVKECPEKNARYLETRAASKRQHRAIQKEAMSEADLELRRKYERERKRKQREIKSTPLIVKLPLNAFSNSQSEGKAVKRLHRALPMTPRKQRQAVRKLALQLGLPVDTNAENSDETRGRKPLLATTIAQVVEFYSRDVISRQAPGMKDYKQVDGEKIQKRHLYSNLNETYELYKIDHGESHPICRTKFPELKPANVFPLNDMPQNVCVCAIHENVLLCVSVISKFAIAQLPNSGRELINAVVCDRTRLECMNMIGTQCADCKSVTDFYSQHIADLSAKVTYFQWGTIDKKVQKQKCDGSISDVLDCLEKQWPQFLAHCYTKDSQASYFDSAKANLSTNGVVIQVDFSENYQTFYQDEIQSAHWAYSQITLFTCCVWSAKVPVQSICIVSDHLSHDKYSVHVYVAKLLSIVRAENKNITSVKFFSDGCAAQFKNRFLFANLFWLKQNFELEHLEWNYFATSHGKGPVDGLGGSLKRLVRGKVLSRKAVVNNACEFADQCSSSTDTIVVVKPQDILEKHDFLNQRWEQISTLKGTQQVHHVKALGSDYVEHGRVSQGMDVLEHTFTTGSKTRPATNRVEKSIPWKAGDFILTRLDGKKSTKNFVGLVKDSSDPLETEIQFLKRVKPNCSVFCCRQNDISWLQNDSIVKMLTFPTLNKRGQYCFEEDLSSAE